MLSEGREGSAAYAAACADLGRLGSSDDNDVSEWFCLRLKPVLPLGH